MIARRELLKLIDKVIQGEEEIVRLYCQAFLLSPGALYSTVQTRRAPEKTIRDIRKESRRHRSALEGIRTRIMREHQDAY